MISTKGRYALRVMIDLAKQNSDHYIPLKDIADRQEISKKYLEIIVKDKVLDKSGSYAIQGVASMFVEKIEGEFYNIVGLPVAKLYEALKTF